MEAVGGSAELAVAEPEAEVGAVAPEEPSADAAAPADPEKASAVPVGAEMPEEFAEVCPSSGS